MLLLNKKILFLFLPVLIFCGLFWQKPVLAEISPELKKQIEADIGKISFGGQEVSNITESDDKNYDFMSATQDYKIYFKQDPITNKANIKYQRGDSWVEFDTLSKVQIAGEKKTINAIASANDWKYCKYLFGLCNVFGYFKLWGTAAISFNQNIPTGNVAENQTTRFAYPKVWESKDKSAFIDAEYEISPNNFLEEFVLNKFQDIDFVSQNLVLHNVSLKQEGENINFYSTIEGENSSALFFIPAPKMYEKNDHSKESYGLHFELTEVDSAHYILTKVIDQEGKDWLKSEERVWPLVIDATVSFGSEYVFSSASTAYISVASLDATHFVATYYISGYAKAIIGTVSGSTISYGSAYSFSSAPVDYPSISALDSTHFVIAYYECNNALCAVVGGRARIGTVSGTEISFGEKKEFIGGSVYDVSVSALDSTHFVIGYEGPSYGTAIIGTVSDTTISYGSEYVFNPFVATDYISIFALDSTHFVVAYKDGGNSGYGTAIIGTVSDTTISYGSEYVFNQASTGDAISVAVFDSTHFVVGYSDAGNHYYGTAVIGTVSEGVISFGIEYVFDQASTRYYVSADSFDSSNFVIGYNSVSYYGAAIVGTYVPNTVPTITSGPSDGSSSSSTPTNAGSNVSFSLTATDPQSDNYYLAVCKTDSVTANVNSAPTCASGNWCISSSTASESQASCTYTTGSGDAESNAWYAFVCDYSDEPLCSASSQGTGDSGSPFSVNHRPDFTAISDAPDPIIAGSDITFTATASDSDTDGSADTVTMYVCKANDFTGSACGAGGEWCHSSASASNPSCSYTILEGDGTGSKNYYANIIDSHSFASSSNPKSGTFTIGATAPVLNQEHFQIFQDDAGLNSATQYAVEDANYNVALETNFRIRFQIANTGDGAENITRRLEFKEDSGFWTQITTNSNNIRLVDSSNFTDADATTAVLTATGTFTAGQGKDTGSDTSQISLTNGYYTEDEYSLKFESTADNHAYQFRITNAGVELDTYSATPIINFRGAGLRIENDSLRISNGQLRVEVK